ncbi:hypothetical protein [Novosphingobium kaempferiae]|uniref:hypothetical protein n=1 Tax=Novosphingobium kaempferiae TaxID=2896849 RepID=UPI001E534608|nr:hypothetical protein [Novosphingobium kaempferiae]
MMKAPLLTAVALCALALGGCKKTDDQPKAAAGGELLPRSVGDDMLPYDTVQSQASLSAPDAGLGPVRPGGPAVSPSSAPEDDVAADPVEEVPVIEAAPPSPPATP